MPNPERIEDPELAEKMAHAEKQDRDAAHYHSKGETDSEQAEARRAESRGMTKGETVERIERLLELVTGDGGQQLWNDLRTAEELVGRGLDKPEHVSLRQGIRDRLTACRDEIENLIYHI